MNEKFDLIFEELSNDESELISGGFGLDDFDFGFRFDFQPLISKSWPITTTPKKNDGGTETYKKDKYGQTYTYENKKLSEEQYSVKS